MDSKEIFENFKENIEKQSDDKTFSVYYDSSKGFINSSRPMGKSKLLELLSKFDNENVSLGAVLPVGQGNKITLTFYNSKSKNEPGHRYIQITYNPYKKSTKIS